VADAPQLQTDSNNGAPVLPPDRGVATTGVPRAAPSPTIGRPTCGSAPADVRDLLM